MDQKLLTPLELKVMNLLWQFKRAYVKDIIAGWETTESQPKYNTISTIVRILEEKGYVGHEAMGRSHQYFPVVSRGKYQKRLMRNVLENVFSGSLTGMVSSLLDQNNLSPGEIDDLRNLIDENQES